MSWSRRSFIRSSVIATLASMVPLPTSNRRTTDDRLLPRRLYEGATVGLVSPAGVISSPADVNAVQETLASLGLNAHLGRNALNRRGYLAGTDAERATDLMEMFEDDRIDAILALRGGWGLNRILERLDFGTIRRNPKIVMGFSDITSLLLAMYARSGVVSFHGPVGISTWSSCTVNHMKSVLFDGGTPILTNPPSEPIHTICGGRARGRLVGGNLSVITSMLGSSFLPDWSGHLLFLEDVDERVYKIDRKLTQLAMAGILDQVEGVIWGQCSNCTSGANVPSLTLQEVLNDHLVPRGKPAYYGALIGHIRDKFTLPIGIEAEMDADHGSITLLEPAVV